MIMCVPSREERIYRVLVGLFREVLVCGHGSILVSADTCDSAALQYLGWRRSCGAILEARTHISLRIELNNCDVHTSMFQFTSTLREKKIVQAGE